jgi:hypothetical protein
LLIVRIEDVKKAKTIHKKFVQKPAKNAANINKNPFPKLYIKNEMLGRVKREIELEEFKKRRAVERNKGAVALKKSKSVSTIAKKSRNNQFHSNKLPTCKIFKLMRIALSEFEDLDMGLLEQMFDSESQNS